MKFLSTLASTLIYSSLGLLIIPSQARAELCGDTSNLTDAQFATNFPDACTITPSTYKVTLYEFGLCTLNPVIGGSLDRSTCVQTFNNPNGQQVDLAGNREVTLDPNYSERPASNTYSYAYAIASNTLYLKGELKTATSSWKSDGSIYVDSDTENSSRTIANAREFNDTIHYFDRNNNECDFSYSRDYSIGTFDAHVVDNSLRKPSSCLSGSRIVATFRPKSAYFINSSTTGLNVNFIVNDTGLAVISETAGPVFGVRSFSAGPLQIDIKAIN